MSVLRRLPCLLFGLLIWAGPSLLAQEPRFPAPEFESGYSFPQTTTPSSQNIMGYLDMALLLATMSLAAWLILARRSRKGLFLLSLFSLGYFGFYREGCVCAIGAIQNVSLSLFDTHYAVPLTVLFFFLAPLVYALFVGRVFCSSVCPLGAIQDLVAVKPLKLPTRVSRVLATIPYLYLGAGVLLAATGSGFIICRYDPFVGFFRLNGNAPYLYLGAAFLLTGVFVARPYCRFFCPYGVLLGWMSRFSSKHLSITPTDCIQCRLCEDSCPYDYIHKPNAGLARERRQTGVRRLALLLLGLPLMIAVGGYVGSLAAVPMASVNHKVFLVEQLLLQQQGRLNLPEDEMVYTETFQTQGQPEAELMAEAVAVRNRFHVGGWLLGGFLGLVFGVKILGFSLVRNRTDYEVDKADCLSCGRCFEYCPNDPMYKKPEDAPLAAMEV